MQPRYLVDDPISGIISFESASIALAWAEKHHGHALNARPHYVPTHQHEAARLAAIAAILALVDERRLPERVVSAGRIGRHI